MKKMSLFLAIVFCIGLVGCAQPTKPSGNTTTTESTTTTVSSSGLETTGTTEPSVSTDTTVDTSVTESTTASTQISATMTTETTAATKPTAKPSHTTVTTKTDKTTKTTTKTTKTTATTKAPPKTVWGAKTSEIGFGFYGVPIDMSDPNNEGRKFLRSNYVNTVFCNDWKMFETLDTYNTRAWVNVHDVYDLIINGYDWWWQRFDDLWERVQRSGHEDAVLGWYLDEPGDMAAVKAITKYAKEKYGKRFFICFMVNTLDGDLWGGYQGENRHVTKDNIQYLTDIAVDCYWEVLGNEDFYQRQYQKLHEKMPEDCKVWYIPTTHIGYGVLNMSDLEIAQAGNAKIRHLRYMYEQLKNEPPKNRGGILVFAYDFDSSYEQFYSLYNVNQKTGGKWQFVMDECIKIGREICTGKIDK